jgi:hypothetical protein
MQQKQKEIVQQTGKQLVPIADTAATFLSVGKWRAVACVYPRWVCGVIRTDL